jgi:acetyl-CoA synthetase
MSLYTQLVQLGLPASDAEYIAQQVNDDLQTKSPEACWQTLLTTVFKTPYPFSVHQVLYQTIYPDWQHTPAPAWFPDKNNPRTHIETVMQEKGFKQYQAFHQWSVNQYPDFWESIIKKLNLIFDQPYTQLVDLSRGIESPQWLPGAKLNIAKSCFQANATAIAIISQTEQGQITRTTYAALDQLSNRIANSLSASLKTGDRVAIIMPMTREAVAIYLGIIKAGCVVVSIPDSFAKDEIATRLRIADVKAVFCQDHIVRDGKSLPLYERITQASAPRTIVLPATNTLQVSLRQQDIAWPDFLSENSTYTAVTCHPHDAINILFSSGTTGEPKAIPWNHTSPIKCGSDAYLHHNIEPGDVVCWPTNLGWMMGPWLIFASLLNRATIALYEGTPNGKSFGKFVQDAGVTQLGVVPTLVKTWRNTACMEGLNWRAIKLFSSTGERSHIEDMLYLMWLVNYRPILEYCGGTEIAGAYITGTLLQPQAPAACTTPTLGIDFVIIDEHGKPSDQGEVALIPPSIGLSTELLNKNHHDVYYQDMPTLPNGIILRRHGDQVARYANGFYRLMGRVDDTMKLGGIKISAAEIESVLNTLPSLQETAAIAVSPPDGGPSQLIIYVVPKTASPNIDQLKTDMQQLIKQQLNPLFKIHDVIAIQSLPRTASNKIMRRLLRDEKR